MARDPSIDLVQNARDPLARLTARLAQLERQVAQLQAGNPVIQPVVGAPTGTPRVGTPALRTDLGAIGFYLHMGGGVWRSTTLF